MPWTPVHFGKYEGLALMRQKSYAAKDSFWLMEV